ncbi:hypothetical protein MJO28_013585 [Puccinia striiformis f. sp. tritici]|uniref:Uncharacterized protein n=1 Tax=Puccinia striiformis f. sp. tritici TaxID=168172 RepID=A0ACC0DUS9_9BASI|nr:hypothetical protein MJO28_013585 [Puccinia striiformis f. sp. tritici]
MSDLREFNHLCCEYNIGLVSSSSFLAALATSKSSICCCRTTGNNQNESTSGIYLARLISNQAQHIVNHKELSHATHGNPLITWTASQTPGTVSQVCISQFPILETDLIHLLGYTAVVPEIFEQGPSWTVQYQTNNQLRHRNTLDVEAWIQSFGIQKIAVLRWAQAARCCGIKK